ncbi:hypothetical protein LINPERHAP2_LOCUS21782 [Linum perenne]
MKEYVYREYTPGYTLARLLVRFVFFDDLYVLKLAPRALFKTF